MKTPNKIVLANLRQNKKRTRATLIAIILSCTLLFAVGIAYSSYIKYNIAKVAKETGTYHILYYDIDYKKSLAYLENNKDIKDIYIMQQIDSFKKDYENFQVLSYSGKLNPEINISKGREPKNDKEILISKKSLLYLELNIGDKFENYTIVGTYDNYVLEAYPVGDGTLNRNSIITFLTKKDINEANEHSCFYITYKNIKNTYDKVQEDVKYLNIDNTTSKNVQINKEYLKANGVGQDSAKYIMIYIALALTLYFISIFCMLIIYNAFAISLTERKKQFGILRSLGSSKKSIIAMITKELLILSLIAFPISFALGTFLVWLAFKFLDILLGISISLSFDLLTILITIFFVIFSMVLSAYTPGRKASKTSPMEAIRSTKDYKIKKNNRDYKLIKRIFGPEGQLARKNLKRNGKQFSTVITSLTISIILFILVSTVVNFLTIEYRQMRLEDDDQPTIDIQVHYNNRKDIDNFISDLVRLPYADSRIISRMSSVHLDEKNSFYTEEAINNSIYYSIIYSLDKNTYEKVIKDNNLSPNKVLFTNISDYHENSENNDPYKIFKENAQISICELSSGEDSTLTDKNCNVIIPNAELVNKSLKIGTHETGNRTAFFIEDSELENYIQNYPEYFSHENKFYDIEIESANFKKFDEEFLELKDKYKYLSIHYNNEPLDIYNEERRILYIEIIIYAIILFVGLISIAGILNSINNNLSMREREFAMLRSMGYSKKSLNKMISLENIFLVSKSFIYSLIITLAGFLALNQAFNYDGLTNKFIFPPHIVIPYPWLYTLIAFIAVILIILFLTSFSIKKIKNQNIIEAIRKDSI